MKKNKEFVLKKKINHIAFIMDGNGRWAKRRLLPRHLGHKKGVERVIEVLNACKEFNIKVATLYAFSTENWKRPQDEIDHLFQYLEEFFHREIDGLIKDGTQIRVMGDISRLPISTQKTIEESIYLTRNCHNFIFNICLNYGGRDEIVRASKKIAEDVKNSTIDIENINEDTFSNYLMSKGLPEVDLMIRTSGEKRISNYLLWQLAYAEFIFPKTLWPDFTRNELIKCLEEYQSRDRRYGGIVNE